MATGTRPAVDPAWAFPAASLTEEQRKARTEAVLERRKHGVAIEAIGAALGMTRSVVSSVIGHARGRANDPRALTDAQAAIVRQARAVENRHAANRLAEQAAREAAAPPADDRPSDRRMRSLELAEVCRRRAAEFAGHPNIASSFLHLSDLFEAHGPRLYPQFTMKDEGDPRAFTFVDRALQHSPVGSSAAACAEY